MSRYRIQRQMLFDSRKTLKDIQAFFQQYPELDLIKIKDQKENTSLHQCAFQNRLPFLQKFIQYAKKYQQRKNHRQSLFKEWIDSKNSEGFAAIHYAAYKGHIQIIQYLKQQGASTDIQTTSGHNMLHLAAQGDRVETFIYFKNQFDINSVDKKNGTPLHWASYISSQKVVQYLLAQSGKIKLNLKDDEGQTPLHLATAYGNTRIVRKLLLAGADRGIKNNKNQTPKHIAEQNQFWNIKNMLDNKYTCLDYIKFYCNIKVKYEPQNRSPLMPTLFILIYILLITSCFLQMNFQNQNLQIFMIALYSINLFLYISLLPGPKMTEPSQYSVYLKNSNQNALDTLCMVCVHQKPQRSYHCDICHVCIKQYDHHCPWINNCVGKRNIGRFVIFLYLLELCFIGMAIINGLIIYLEIIQQEKFEGWIELNNIFQIQDFLALKIIRFTVSGINVMVFLCFFFPILLLIFVQTKNLLLNQTTYQRFSKNARRSILSESSSSIQVQHYRRDKQKKNNLSIKNCKIMCFGNKQYSTSLATDESLMQHLT